MVNFKQLKRWLVAGVGIPVLCASILVGDKTYAEGIGISMSPPNQKIVLNAGESYTGSFTVSNAQTNDGDFRYVVEVKPFYVDGDDNIIYQDTEGYNQIVNWTKVNPVSGVLPLGGSEKIDFTINVPSNAPAGGQYMAITVTSNLGKTKGDDEENELGLNMTQNISMAHIVYTEIAGTTIRQGEIQSADVPSFLLNGNITASSTIKNTGNTHGTATYKLQVFPLFSNEEVYTNEEKPDEKTILPDRSLYNETVWDKTPDVGIFNVKYTVEFEGVTTEVSKLVIKCPIWLMFIIIFVVFALIFYFVAKVRAWKKAAKK